MKDCTSETFSLIERIIARAESEQAILRGRISLLCALSCLYANYDADLQALLDSEDYDFVHDISGIQRHMDLETGRLTDEFVPRCLR